ncbi:MAG TPA: HAMP domain-containing sensor histidine kinase [Elusimicrobiota bacterium]|nr:HAMP domain-containing sensor histidine kinase [Elusimicrobiota bacterium]
MKNWSLRARLTTLLAAVLCLYTALSTVAYLTSSRAEDRLETAFGDELSFLADLPAQRARLRQIDIDADSYLLTRREDWLLRRRTAVADFREWHVRLGSRLPAGPQSSEWNAVGGAFERYASAQEAMLKRVREGSMTLNEATRLALAKEQVDELIERMVRFGRLGFERMDRQRRRARAAAFATFGFILVIGILGALALAAAISRVIVEPVLRLRDQAAHWKLGDTWTFSDGDNPREVKELMDAMRTMAHTLNEQFERERQTNRLKSQLVSGVSHEFNNALSVIHTAHILLMENDSEPGDAPWHEMMEANIRALSAMATNLLNLGRLEAGKFDLDLQRVDLAPLLHGTFERLGVIGKRKKQTLKLDIEKDLPAVSGDRDALPLVVANLLTNAFKYTPEGGSVTLGARRRLDGRVEVSVADTGIGVAPEDRSKIFSGYYRTEQSKKTAKGFGVGLALSRMILDAHHTALELDSEPGKGSRFFFALPSWS